MNKNEFIEIINKIISMLSDLVESENIIKLNRVNDNLIGCINNKYNMSIYNTKYDEILIINDSINYEQEELIKSRFNKEFADSGVYIKFFRLSKETNSFDRQLLGMYISTIFEDED